MSDLKQWIYDHCADNSSFFIFKSKIIEDLFFSCYNVVGKHSLLRRDLYMNKTAWIFSYKLKKGVSEEHFMELTKKLHDEIISKAKGFISWEHYLQKDIWTDFVLWETEEDANNATTIGQGTDQAKDFYACIQMNTCRALISKLIKKY